MNDAPDEVAVGPVPSDRMLEDFKKLFDKCHHKRSLLHNAAIKRADRRKKLRFFAGMLALLSGASITAVLATFVEDSRAIKILSAVLAFASGLISLLLEGFYDPQDTQHMFSGAFEFLALRDKVDIQRRRPKLTDVEAHKALGGLRKSTLLRAGNMIHSSDASWRVFMTDEIDDSGEIGPTWSNTTRPPSSSSFAGF